MEFKTDIEIAQACEMKPITEIAKLAHVDEKYLEQYGKYKAKIDPKLLAETDRENGKLILVTAISEAENFTSIPTRVTMNEYIDIAKCYSTESSGGFINGILDRIISQLVNDGKIVKTGKGLL